PTLHYGTGTRRGSGTPHRASSSPWTTSKGTLRKRRTQEQRFWKRRTTRNTATGAIAHLIPRATSGASHKRSRPSDQNRGGAGFELDLFFHSRARAPFTARLVLAAACSWP